MPESKGPTISYKTSSKVKLNVSELELGMYVSELDCPWTDTPFLFQGFTLENQEDINAVKEYCDYVYIDVERQVNLKLQPRDIGKLGSSKTHLIRSVPVEKEYATANAAYKNSTRIIKNIMDDIRLGKSIDTDQAKEVVEGCVDTVMRNPDALLLFTGIKNKDEYTSEHSLNVSILSIAFGRTMGMEKNKLVELGTAGLLHDVGKILTPLEVLNKPGALTDEEYAVMKEHTTHGRDILMSSDGDVSMLALDVAHGHHEHLDGTGYPRGLKEDQLTEYTKMVAITDAFDAITSDRIYFKGRTIMEAFRILDRSRGSHFDPKHVMNFIKSVGLFPPGSVVVLSDGRTGVVLETHPKLKLRPKILVVQDPKQPEDMSHHILDLAKVFVDAEGKKLHIIKMVHADDVNVNIQALKDDGYFKEAVMASAEQEAKDTLGSTDSITKPAE